MAFFRNLIQKMKKPIYETNYNNLFDKMDKAGKTKIAQLRELKLEQEREEMEIKKQQLVNRKMLDVQRDVSKNVRDIIKKNEEEQIIKSQMDEVQDEIAEVVRNECDKADTAENEQENQDLTNANYIMTLEDEFRKAVRKKANKETRQITKTYSANCLDKTKKFEIR